MKRSTRTAGPPTLRALFCSGRDHRARRNGVVKIYSPADGCERHGWVLTEGFDYHGRHVGWVGFEARGELGARLSWLHLCELGEGDAELAQGDPDLVYEFHAMEYRLVVRRRDGTEHARVDALEAS